MKKTFANIRTLAALFIASATLAACSNEDSGIINSEQPAAEQAPQVYTLTLQAGKADNAQTRALKLEDSGALTAYWKNGETVDVRQGATSLGSLTVSNASADGQTCTLSGTITGTVDKEARLSLFYNYFSGTVNASQTGTLASAAANDYANAVITVANADGGNITIKESSASFKTQVAMLKITMKDGSDNLLKATKLEISGDDISTITFSPTDATYTDNGNGVLYFSMPSASRLASANSTTTDVLSAMAVTFTATVGSDTYTATKEGYSFEAGKYYATELTMTAAPAGTDLSKLNAAYKAADGETLTGTLGGNYQVSIADGATVTLKDVTINGENEEDYGWAGITCEGNATIILSGTNTVKGFFENYPGIYVPEGSTLTIQGSGSLDASSGYSAGIGGGLNINCGNIVIESGTVIATGGESAAGIGSGKNGKCGDINISGGTVTATGGEYGAGIGSGDEEASCSDITISGGTVTATGGDYGAGIGSGSEGSCGAITISGGTIEATGGKEAAGIGSGYQGSCGAINITSGVTSVTATKGEDAPNSIGASEEGSCGTVTIEDASKVTQK